MARPDWCEGSGRVPAGIPVHGDQLARCTKCRRLVKVTSQGHLRQHRTESSTPAATK